MVDDAWGRWADDGGFAGDLRGLGGGGYAREIVRRTGRRKRHRSKLFEGYWSYSEPVRMSLLEMFLKREIARMHLEADRLAVASGLTNGV